MDGSTCPFIGPWCSLVWERRTTCWVTMRVLDPDILVIQRPPLFREGRDLVHHVPACSEGARACWGGGGLLLVPPHFCWGGGRGSKKSAPQFPGPQGEPAHGLHPRFVVAEIWADRASSEGMGCVCVCVCVDRVRYVASRGRVQRRLGVRGTVQSAAVRGHLVAGISIRACTTAPLACMGASPFATASPFCSGQHWAVVVRATEIGS